MLQVSAPIGDCRTGYWSMRRWSVCTSNLMEENTILYQQIRRFQSQLSHRRRRFSSMARVLLATRKKTSSDNSTSRPQAHSTFTRSKRLTSRHSQRAWEHSANVLGRPSTAVEIKFFAGIIKRRAYGASD